MTIHDAHHGEAHRSDSSPNRSRTSWIVRVLMLALLGAGAFYIVAEHGAHLLAAWPLLFLLACPFMHFFHSGHGGHGHGAETPPSSNQPNSGA